MEGRFEVNLKDELKLFENSNVDFSRETILNNHFFDLKDIKLAKNLMHEFFNLPEPVLNKYIDQFTFNDEFLKNIFEYLPEKGEVFEIPKWKGVLDRVYSNFSHTWKTINSFNEKNEQEKEGGFKLVLIGSNFDISKGTELFKNKSVLFSINSSNELILLPSLDNKLNILDSILFIRT